MGTGKVSASNPVTVDAFLANERIEIFESVDALLLQGLRLLLTILGCQLSKEPFTLVETCPPLRLLQPPPSSPASSTTVLSPSREVCRAACNPV